MIERLRQLGRLTSIALLWSAALLAVAVAANGLGIAMLGSIEGWQRWLDRTAGFFLLWRLCLYAFTAFSWRWMRRRVLACDDSEHARRRLVRTEVASAVAIIVLEAGLLLQSRE